MDPTRRDLEKEGFVENIIYEAAGDGEPYSPSMYLNGDEGEADGSGDNGAGDGEPDDSGEGEAGEVYIYMYMITTCINGILYVYIYIK